MKLLKDNYTELKTFRGGVYKCKHCHSSWEFEPEDEAVEFAELAYSSGDTIGGGYFVFTCSLCNGSSSILQNKITSS